MYEPRPRIKLSQKKYVELKKYIYERDICCVWCGNPNNLTPAHIIRRSQGGDDSPRNIVAGCVVSPDGGKGCHNKFDDREIELPGSVAVMLKGEPLYLDNDLVQR